MCVSLCQTKLWFSARKKEEVVFLCAIFFVVVACDRVRMDLTSMRVVSGVRGRILPSPFQRRVAHLMRGTNH